MKGVNEMIVAFEEMLKAIIDHKEFDYSAFANTYDLDEIGPEIDEISEPRIERYREILAMVKRGDV